MTDFYLTGAVRLRHPSTPLFFSVRSQALRLIARDCPCAGGLH